MSFEEKLKAARTSLAQSVTTIIDAMVPMEFLLTSECQRYRLLRIGRDLKEFNQRYLVGDYLTRTEGLTEFHIDNRIGMAEKSLTMIQLDVGFLEKELEVKVSPTVTDILGKDFGLGVKYTVEQLAERLGENPILLKRVIDMGYYSYDLCCKLGKLFGNGVNYWWGVNMEHQRTFGLKQLNHQKLGDVIPLSVKPFN